MRLIIADKYDQYKFWEEYLKDNPKESTSFVGDFSTLARHDKNTPVGIYIATTTKAIELINFAFKRGMEVSWV